MGRLTKKWEMEERARREEELRRKWLDERRNDPPVGRKRSRGSISRRRD